MMMNLSIFLFSKIILDIKEPLDRDDDFYDERYGDNDETD